MNYWLAIVLTCGVLLPAWAGDQPNPNPGASVVEKETEFAPVDDATMQRIYGEVKTPFKYGVFLRGDTTNQLVDCPGIFRRGRQWFMMYVAITDAVGYETYMASSDDLLNWTKWTGPHLVEPTEPWDKTCAHKPLVLKHEGVVYHCYCAVGAEGRVIALATSSDLRAARKP